MFVLSRLMAEPATTTDPAPAAAVVPAQPAPESPPTAEGSPSIGATVETAGPAILALVTPVSTTAFVSNVPGWNAITRNGTSGPPESADTVIAIAAANGVTLERR